MAGSKYWFYNHINATSDMGYTDFGYMIGIDRDTTINDKNYKIVKKLSVAGSYEDCQFPPCLFDFSVVKGDTLSLYQDRYFFGPKKSHPDKNPDGNVVFTVCIF